MGLDVALNEPQGDWASQLSSSVSLSLEKGHDARLAIGLLFCQDFYELG